MRGGRTDRQNDESVNLLISTSLVISLDKSGLVRRRLGPVKLGDSKDQLFQWSNGDLVLFGPVSYIFISWVLDRGLVVKLVRKRMQQQLSFSFLTTPV